MKAEEQGYRTLGVLGGMGPSATVDFMAKLVALTRASRDQEHIPVIVNNLPQIPDRSTAILTNSDAPLPYLSAGLRALERAGAEVFVIPCNSAHHWHDRLALETERPLLHIVDPVKEKLLAAGCQRVALLATQGAVLSGFYQRRLRGAVAQLILPNARAQAAVDATIAAVKASRAKNESVLEVAQDLLSQGAERVILGCTELPVAFAGAPILDRCIDATALLAQACVEICGGRVRRQLGRVA